ncbi:MAG: RNA polymerase sigma factor [Flavobacteriaceae bacterium]|nr:RNA polymerase sigma factor [Flavobacteriaceae bacterium]
MSLTKTHIDDLLALCLQGNQFAQMEVYNRYYGAMYTTALRIVKQTDEAEDIMQEAFLTAFNKLHTFKGEASFGAWLKRIVVNQSISKSRKMEHNEEWEDYKMSAIAEEPFEDSNETYTELKSNEVLHAINDLKTNYSAVLTLHYIEGYDYEEIAQIMDISYANSRTLLSRARESLRKKLHLQTN